MSNYTKRHLSMQKVESQLSEKKRDKRRKRLDMRVKDEWRGRDDDRENV